MTGRDRPAVTVGVVSICGARPLARCLDALAAQRGAPEFEVVAVVPPGRDDLEAARAARPGVRFVARDGERTPPEMARRAVLEAAGDRIALLEDHGAPDPDWLARLLAALTPGRAAAGGAMAIDDGAGPVGWALSYADFFRYLPPAEAGPSPSLTHCNVAYRRADLDAVAPLWASVLHETELHAALARRGALWLEPAAVVATRRRAGLGAALAERRAFGRLFGASRARLLGPGRRLLYAVLAPLLPPLLLGRMARAAAARPGVRRPFLRALPALVPLVLAWTWGECVGYWTLREPVALPVAGGDEAGPGTAAE